MALFSFIHSVNTTLGMSIFESVAAVLAAGRFKKVEKQYIIGQEIRIKAQENIDFLIEQELATAKQAPDKLQEIETIREASLAGKTRQIKPVKVDLYLEDSEGRVHLFDLKTAKPNKSNFKDFKRTLLQWIAVALCHQPTLAVASYLAIPYNPYAPKPYQRWTMNGMIDLQQELKVAAEFWDFLAGNGTYESLLGCFEAVGTEMREELNDYFAKFKASKQARKHS